MSKLIFGNQKMYMTKENVNEFIQGLKKIPNLNNVVIFPSYVFVEDYKGIVACGGQDVSANELGAYTGDISSKQLKSIGAKYCLIGHSERRKYHNENSDVMLCKITNLLSCDIVPVLCIGENEIQYENKETNNVLMDQIDEIYLNLKKEYYDKIIIAYEPVWAIGTGKTPTNNEIAETIEFIKNHIRNNYTDKKQTVLYGGSVNNKNISQLNKIEIVDGYLIGGASSKIEEFTTIIESSN